MKRRGEKNIPASYFDGTAQEAQIFAKNSNKLGALQTDLENANYYHEEIKKGRSYNSILEEAKENEQDGSAKKIVSLAHLNPNGKTMDALEKTENSESDGGRNITNIGIKIGHIRALNEHITDAHENELFEYMMKDEDNIPTDKELADQNNPINRSINSVRFDNKQPLNLDKFQNKSDTRIQWEAEKKELEQQVAEIRKDVNPSKKTGWTGLKEKAIASIAKDKSVDAINQAEKDFNNNVNGIKDNYQKLLEKKRDELIAVSNKLAKHLLSEKNLIEGEKNQQSLFQSTDKNFQTISPESFTKLLDTLKKAFPSIKVFSDKKQLEEKLNKYKSKIDLRTPNGTIYGAKFPDGTIYLNTDNLNANTPIHEYGHVFEQMFPTEFERGKLMLRNSEQGRKLIAETKANPAYKGLTQAQIESEALVRAIGDKGESIFNSNPTLLKKFQDWLSDIFAKLADKVGRVTGIKSLQFTADTKLDNFTKQVVGELLGGKVLSKEVGSEIDSSVKFQDSNYKSTVAFERWKGKNKLVSGADIQEIKSGEPVVVQGYHGTTNEFYVFDSTVKGNVEGHLGKVNYFTSDEQDASGNYQSDGADLTGRIDRRQEELENILEYEYSDDKGNIIISKVKDDFGITTKQLKELYPSGVPKDIKANELSRFIAEKELKGGTEKVLDVYIKLNNPVVLGNKSTWFDTMNISESDMNDAVKEIADEYDVSEEEAKSDYAMEIQDRAIENTGYEKIHIEALTDALNANGYDGSMASEILGDDYYETEVDLNELEKKLRKSELYENDNGEMASSQVIADFFKNLGYDGIILTDVSERFKNMGIGGGTSHIHVFDEFSNQIKLADGTNTTFNPDSKDIRFQFSPSELQPKVEELRSWDLTDAEIRDYLLEAGNTTEQIDEVLGKEVKGNKRVLNRAFDGSTDTEVKQFLEDYGLSYETESQDTVEEEVNDIIKEIGLENAIIAVENADITGAHAAVIYSKAVDDIESILSDGNLTDEEFTDLKRKQASLINILDIQARQAGRFISMLNRIYRLSNFHFSYEYTSKRMEEAKGSPLSDVEIEKLKSIELQNKELQAKVAELEKQRDELVEKQAVENIKFDIERKNKRSTPDVKKKAKALISEGLEELAQFLGSIKMAEGNVMPQLTKSLVKIGKGLIDLGQATVENVFEKVKEKIADKYGDKLNIDTYEDVFKNEIADYDNSGNSNDKFKIPHSVIRSIVEAGTTDINEIVEKVLEIYPEKFKELSEAERKRKIRDIITKYGQTIESTKDDIDDAIFKAKRIGRLISGKEDLLDGKLPKRSGLQREKPSPEERILRKEIEQLLKNHPKTQEEISKLWATAIDRAKTRVKNKIEELQVAIDKKEALNKTKNVQNYNDKDLDDLKDKLKSKKEEYQKLFPENKTQISDEQKLNQLINQKNKKLKQLKEQKATKVFKQDKKNPIDRAKFPTQDAELKALEAKIKTEQEEIAVLSEYVKYAETKKLDLAKKIIRKRIKDLEERIEKKDFTTKEKLTKPIDEALKNLQEQKQKLADDYELMKWNHEQKNRTIGDKLLDGSYEAAGLFKSIKATFDLSAPLRQGLPFLLSNPKLWFKSMKEMHTQAINATTYEEFISEIRNSNDYKLMQDSGLDLTGVDGTQEKKQEEQFSSKLIQGVPIYKQINNFSARGYSGFLNNIRVGAFRQGVKALKDSGIAYEDNPAMYKALAEAINNATGRGDSPGGKFGKLLNAIFFSPKMITSRFLMFHDILRTDIPFKSKSRVIAASNIASTIITIAVFNLLGTLAKNAFDDEDDDELLDGLNYNPIHTDFAKVKAKDTRYDLTAGFSQIVRTVVRIIAGKSINSKGVETDLVNTYGKSVYEPMSDYFRNKLSPLTSIVANLVERKNPFNRYEKLEDLTKDSGLEIAGQVTRGLFAPMSVDMVIGNIFDEDKFFKDLGETVFSFYGSGVMQYKDNTDNTKETDDSKDKENKVDKKRRERKQNRNKRD